MDQKLELTWCWSSWLLCSDATWMLRHHKSLATWLLVQQLFQSNIKIIIKGSHYWAFVRRIHQFPVNSTHKGPSMWTMNPSYNIIMDLAVPTMLNLICETSPFSEITLCLWFENINILNIHDGMKNKSSCWMQDDRSFDSVMWILLKPSVFPGCMVAVIYSVLQHKMCHMLFSTNIMKTEPNTKNE